MSAKRLNPHRSSAKHARELRPIAHLAPRRRSNTPGAIPLVEHRISAGYRAGRARDSSSEVCALACQRSGSETSYAPSQIPSSTRTPRTMAAIATARFDEVVLSLERPSGDTVERLITAMDLSPHQAVVFRRVAAARALTGQRSHGQSGARCRQRGLSLTCFEHERSALRRDAPQRETARALLRGDHQGGAASITADEAACAKPAPALRAPASSHDARRPPRFRPRRTGRTMTTGRSGPSRPRTRPSDDIHRTNTLGRWETALLS